MKTYEHAQKELFNTEWRVVPCFVGNECWCRMVEPINHPTYEVKNSQGEIEIEVIDNIIGAGSINKEMADYIVGLHNEKIKK